MKNQDIFEVFKHLKTILGGAEPKKTENQTQKKEEIKERSPAFSLTEREARLRNFHRKHEALSRKIILENLPNAPQTGSVIALRKRAEILDKANPSPFLPKEENSASPPPLFPPSFP